MQSCSSPNGSASACAYLVRMLGNAFRSNFQHFEERERMYRRFVDDATKILVQRGFANFGPTPFYFPRNA